MWWSSRSAVFALLLSTVFGFTTTIVSLKKVIGGVALHVKSESPHDGCEKEPTKRQRGERRLKLLSRVRAVVPKKRNVACLVIATLAFFRGPTAILSKDYDLNVAHARVNVKVSGVKVEATIKDLPLLPLKAPSFSKRKAVAATPSPLATGTAKMEVATVAALAAEPVIVRKISQSGIVSTLKSEPGTIVIAAGGGILAGTIARRKKKDDNNFEELETEDVDPSTSMEDATREQTPASSSDKTENAYLESLEKKEANPFMATVSKITESINKNRFGYDDGYLSKIQDSEPLELSDYPKAKEKSSFEESDSNEAPDLKSVYDSLSKKDKSASEDSTEGTDTPNEDEKSGKLKSTDDE